MSHASLPFSILLLTSLVLFTPSSQASPFPSKTKLGYKSEDLDGSSSPKKRHSRQPKGTWEDKEGDGPARIVIDLDAQKAYFYRGDVRIGTSPVSTGRDGYETPTGTFRVLAKHKEYHSNLYGNFVDSNGRVIRSAKASEKPPKGATYQPSPMPYFIRVTNDGVGLHGGLLPGFPASHGCIRLPQEMAQKFYSNISVGQKVEIRD